MPVFRRKVFPLSVRNKHVRDKQITFNSAEHKYNVHGLKYLSTTKLISQCFPEFNAEEVIKKMKSSKNWESSKYNGLSNDEIKAEWISARNQGTFLHECIEKYYNGEYVADGPPEYSSQFLPFAREASDVLTPFRSEWKIFDEEHQIAGTVDMAFLRGGEMILYDWKRSESFMRRDNPWENATGCLAHLPNAKFWKYSMQLNVYKMILERNYGWKVGGMFLLGMHPKFENFINVEVPDLEEETKALFEMRLQQLNPQQTQSTV